ncbi:hypothetical protein MFUL124B02_31455 [Myxococcus fulvus 124B02]|nr:hypothetical protein MFUL124B02_31455 [Myxococcus fulvus 124B02]
MKPLLSLGLSLLLLWPSAPAEACGPGADAVSGHSHPDPPLERFAAGNLELLTETLHPMYLAYAWRWMMEVPTTPQEQRAVVDTWKRMRGELEMGDVMQVPDEPWTAAQKREAYDLALTRWKQTRHAPWLVAAMLKARGDSPEVGALLVAAARVPISAPQGLTLALHTVRLLREQQLLDAARERLAAVPHERVHERPTPYRLVHRERLLLATSWESFLGIALERASKEAPWTRPSPGDPGLEPPAAFSYAALAILNTPLTARRLGELGGNEQVPPAHRRQLRWTAFVRAAIVGDDETLQAMATTLAESEPSARSELRALLERTSVEERMFEARLLVMGLPVLSVHLESDPSRLWPSALTTLTYGKSNWWCGTAPTPVTPFSFVGEEERVTAAAEWGQLVEAGTSVAYFSKVALAWAQEHPKDPRSPIALYRAVRASRRGCPQNTPEAMAAFRYLHRHYGKSTWAQQVPYVY